MIKKESRERDDEEGKKSKEILSKKIEEIKQPEGKQSSKIVAPKVKVSGDTISRAKKITDKTVKALDHAK